MRINKRKLSQQRFNPAVATATSQAGATVVAGAGLLSSVAALYGAEKSGLLVAIKNAIPKSDPSETKFEDLISLLSPPVTLLQSDHYSYADWTQVCSAILVW